VRTFALIVSVLLHPLLMATYGCLLLLFGIHDTVYDFLTPFETKWRLSLIVFLFSFLFPVLNIFILFRLKKIPSITLSGQNERSFPYLVTAVFYFGLAYLLMDVNVWPSIKLFVFGAGLAILVTALINFRTKISAHMVGIGGLLGVIISASFLIRFDMTLFYIGIIVAAGLIGAARLILQEHTPSQIYSGFFLGLFVQGILFFCFQTFIFA
jgi:hypothetical protein